MSACTDEQRPAWWETPDFDDYHDRQQIGRTVDPGVVADVLAEFEQELRWLGQHDAVARLRAALARRELDITARDRLIEEAA